MNDLMTMNDRKQIEKVINKNINYMKEIMK